MPPRAKILVAFLAVLVLLPVLLSACPLCKDALEDANSGVPNQLGRGFYYSILLMVSVPFVALGALFLRIAQLRRRGLPADLSPAARGHELVPDARARS